MTRCPCGCRRPLDEDRVAVARRSADLWSCLSAVRERAERQPFTGDGIQLDLREFLELGETLAWLLAETAHGAQYVESVDPFLAEAVGWEQTAQRLVGPPELAVDATPAP